MRSTPPSVETPTALSLLMSPTLMPCSCSVSGRKIYFFRIFFEFFFEFFFDSRRAMRTNADPLVLAAVAAGLDGAFV
jgi:hypothetical protein